VVEDLEVSAEVPNRVRAGFEKHQREYVSFRSDAGLQLDVDVLHLGKIEQFVDGLLATGA
jgi:hypothetical protein